ncbi:MAG: hypothetical protein AB7S68_33270 [Polyangiaceae bacterium]
MKHMELVRDLLTGVSFLTVAFFAGCVSEPQPGDAEGVSVSQGALEDDGTCKDCRGHETIEIEGTAPLDPCEDEYGPGWESSGGMCVCTSAICAPDPGGSGSSDPFGDPPEPGGGGGVEDDMTPYERAQALNDCLAHCMSTFGQGPKGIEEQCRSSCLMRLGKDGMRCRARLTEVVDLGVAGRLVEKAICQSSDGQGRVCHARGVHCVFSASNLPYYGSPADAPATENAPADTGSSSGGTGGSSGKTSVPDPTGTGYGK